MLEREIALELSLACDSIGAANGSWSDPSRLTAELVETLPTIRERVDLDIRASLTADPSQGSFDELVFCSPGVAAILRHRVAHEFYLQGLPLMAKIIAEDCRSQTGIDLHPGAEIGDGFSIANAAGLTIGETAAIGRNVRMYSPVVLGESISIAVGPSPDAKGEGRENTSKVVPFALSRTQVPARRHPLIEDDVVIYAGACLYGPIIVGRGSSIGRNVWLARDVPPGSHLEHHEEKH